MRPKNLRSRIFLDSGDPAETRNALKLLGFLDGQTTNPTLISNHPKAKERISAGEKFTKEEIILFYKEVIQEVSAIIPEGSVSIEVYSDSSTSSDEMIRWAREMFSWIPNAHVKLPTTQEGLRAAEQAVKSGIRVNMTLCFSQEQAAAVHAATRGAKKGQVFVSPFIGRLDDRGENGMDLISNILHMYRKADSHVEVLTASIRNLNHLMSALTLGSDIATVPFKIIEEWAPKRDVQSDEVQSPSLRRIPYEEIDMNKAWDAYSITHDLTKKGIERFSNDWNNLIIQR